MTRTDLISLIMMLIGIAIFALAMYDKDGRK